MPSSTSAYAGAALSGALALLAVADQFSTHWVRDDVARHYGGWGLHPNPLTMVLIGAFVCAALLFLWAARSDDRGRRGTARVLAIVLVVGGVGFASLATLASEYGGPVLVPLWRVLPWVVPVVAALHAASIRSPGGRRLSAGAGRSGAE